MTQEQDPEANTRKVALAEADILCGRTLAAYLMAGLTMQEAAERVTANWKLVAGILTKGLA